MSRAARLNLVGKKKFRHSSNGSATSKAAAGRKNRMLANRAAAFTNSPQSVYLKGRQNVFTKWLCLGCGDVPLCNPKCKMDEKSSSQLLPKVSCS